MWPNPELPADLVTLTEEILNGKLHFLCNVNASYWTPIFRTTNKNDINKR